MIFNDAFEQQRCATLARQIAQKVAISDEVFQAFCNTPREIFVPISSLAYELDPAPLAAGQWISSPLTVAKMTMALEPKGARNCLEIGLGSGYQSALLSVIIPQVIGIERIRSLYEQAKSNLKSIKSKAIARCSDGMQGLSLYAPYDRILLSAAASNIPDVLFAQLSPNGILVAPMAQGGKQMIIKYKKSPTGQISEEVLEACEFVPIIEGISE